MQRDPLEQALEDSAPNCPRCLHARDLVGEPGALFWACDCGVEAADSP